jgi:hypothetical protein
MTRPAAAPPCPRMESALAYAATESRARNCEIQVLLASDGSYRAVAADATPKEDETLVALVDAEGETLVYALRMVA